MSDSKKSSEISSMIIEATKKKVQMTEELIKLAEETGDSQEELVEISVNGQQYKVPKDKYEKMKADNKQEMQNIKTFIKEYAKEMKDKN